MARAFGIHEIELRPDVPPENVEQFLREELARMGANSACKISLLKGDRGTRAGKYLLLMEFESAENRNRWFPVADGEPSPEAQQYIGPLAERLGTFTVVPPGEPGTYTDYVEVAP